MQFFSFVAVSAAMLFSQIEARATPLAAPVDSRGMNVATMNPFQVSNIYTSQTNATDAGVSTLAIHFVWTDPNSNYSSSICSSTWTETEGQTQTNYPTAYIPCDKTAKVETFQWYFKSYTSASDFELQLGHSFQDDVNFSPPYDQPQFFAMTNVTLACQRESGYTACYQEQENIPLKANIYGESD